LYERASRTPSSGSYKLIGIKSTIILIASGKALPKLVPIAIGMEALPPEHQKDTGKTFPNKFLLNGLNKFRHIERENL